jgi:hypothetical protein
MENQEWNESASFCLSLSEIFRCSASLKGQQKNNVFSGPERRLENKSSFFAKRKSTAFMRPLKTLHFKK